MIQKNNVIATTYLPSLQTLLNFIKLEKMDYTMLKTNAINAINALLEAQLIAVSRESGIDISILQKYVGDSSAPVIAEKKKRAPPKKKVAEPVNTELPTTEVSTTEVQVVAPVVEKKKRAPPKKKVAEPVVDVPTVIDGPTTETDSVTEVPVVEKKKRAPPKKKVAETVVDVPTVVDGPTTEVDVTNPVPEKKKRAPPKKKVAETVAQNDVPLEEKKKRAPPKKKTEEPANKCYICKNTKDLCSTGNSDGFVCEKCISNPESAQAFCVTCKRYEETDGDGYCGKCQDLAESETIKIDSSDDEEEDIEYVESSRHPVREVDISGTVYLVDHDNIAFLKSSKKRVGKYNRDKHQIQALDADSDSDSDSSSSEDELPIDDDDM